MVIETSETMCAQLLMLLRRDSVKTSQNIMKKFLNKDIKLMSLLNLGKKVSGVSEK